MKVLLLNPPFLKKFSRPQRSPAVTKSGTLYFPIWLAGAAGVLEEAGFEIDLVDAPADGYGLDYVLDRAGDFVPKLIVVDTSTPSIFNDVKVAKAIKEKIPGSFVVLVGTHVSALPEDSLNIEKNIDACARREYDYTLRDLAIAIEQGKDLTTVMGLSLRKGQDIRHTPDRPFIENLDQLPFVSRVYKKFLNINNYFNPNALCPMVTIMASRGCAFHCTFCVYPQTLTGHKVRLRSIENVIAEMKYIEKEFPEAKSVFFEDDTLTVNKKRCRDLSEEMIKNGTRILWTANTRADLDYETMRIMKKSGCHTLCVGFESGSQLILDAMKKNIRVQQMERFMEDARRAGILIHGCFMAGLPGETRETLPETLNLAKRLKPDTAQFYPVMVYPGTEAYQWYQEHGCITTDDFSRWLTPSGLHNTVIRTYELSSGELVRFCDTARRKFYLRPYYLGYKLKQMFIHPSMIKRTVKAARTFFSHLMRSSDLD